MYDVAKKAREAMKSKAKRIAAGEPGAKVDSSSYEPPKDALNADVKTGLRPISRRAFKAGGKVTGEKAKSNLGVTPRSYANAKINRNVKDANEDREGLKHVGGMKKGGRAKKEHGGGLYEGNKKVVSPAATKAEPESKLPKNPPLPPARPKDLDAKPEMRGMSADEAQKFMEGRKAGGRTKRANGGIKVAPGSDYIRGDTAYDRRINSINAANRVLDKDDGSMSQSDRKKAGHMLLRSYLDESKKDERKAGGRTKKMMGGPMMGDPRMSMVKDKAMEFAGNPVTPGLKNGGKAKHPDEAMDKALIKKMVKPEARTGKSQGGMKRMNRESGGGVFSGAGYPEKVPGVVPGGRMARKDGGRAKGKTNINIIIAAGKGDQPDGMMAPPPGAPPPGLPIPVPGGPQGGPPPMPMAAPPAPPPQMPPQMPPMARKRGGRASYKDMTAGAGSGEGRLQKTEIQENKRSARKAGGKVYRSYKDMDAGAGSGLGRLEKTEIQSRKH